MLLNFKYENIIFRCTIRLTRKSKGYLIHYMTLLTPSCSQYSTSCLNVIQVALDNEDVLPCKMLDEPQLCNGMLSPYMVVEPSITDYIW